MTEAQAILVIALLAVLVGFHVAPHVDRIWRRWWRWSALRRLGARAVIPVDFYEEEG